MNKIDISQVCGVIDAQGYVINGQFYPKEVALVSHKFSMKILCDIHVEMKNMNEKDRKTAEWIYRYTGLPLESKDDYWKKTGSQYSTVVSGIDTILAFYNWVQCPEKPIIAVKNTQIVPILQMWDIKYIQIPEKLDPFSDIVYKLYMMKSPPCEYHKNGGKRCALIKANALWNVLQLKRI